MSCEFNRSTEKVGLEIHPSKTKILSNQEARKQNEITVDNIKIEVLQKNESAKYLGQKITFEEQETVEIKNRLKNSMGSVPQVQTGTYLKIISPMPKTALVQHGNHANADVCEWNMDTIERT